MERLVKNDDTYIKIENQLDAYIQKLQFLTSVIKTLQSRSPIKIRVFFKENNFREKIAAPEP